MISREDELGWKACDTKVSYANTKACRLPNLLKEERGDLNIKASAVSFPSCITSGCAASFALICIIYIYMYMLLECIYIVLICVNFDFES